MLLTTSASTCLKYSFLSTWEPFFSPSLYTKYDPAHLVDPHGVEPELVEHGVGLVPGGEGGEEVPLALRLDLVTNGRTVIQDSQFW